MVLQLKLAVAECPLGAVVAVMQSLIVCIGSRTYNATYPAAETAGLHLDTVCHSKGVRLDGKAIGPTQDQIV